ENENLRVGQQRFQSRSAFDARHFWQVDVHQNDIRPASRKVADCLFSGGAGADAFQVLTAADQSGPALTHVVDIFDQPDSDDGFPGTIDCQRRGPSHTVWGAGRVVEDCNCSFVPWPRRDRLSQRGKNSLFCARANGTRKWIRQPAPGAEATWQWPATSRIR